MSSTGAPTCGQILLSGTLIYNLYIRITVIGIVSILYQIKIIEFLYFNFVQPIPIMYVRIHIFQLTTQR